MNIYRDVGCSQEDHLPHCGHFGETGGYLSAHAKDCPSDEFKPCTCNPTARAQARMVEENDPLANATWILEIPPGITIRPIEFLGMQLEQWTYKSCTAEIGTGPDWATLSSIESKEHGKGHATQLLMAAKKHYEAKGKKFRGSVPLNTRMATIYHRLGIDYVGLDGEFVSVERVKQG